jgi:hypothetical protein
METYIDLHVVIEPIVEKQVVGHANAMRLHRVAGAIIIITDLIYS